MKDIRWFYVNFPAYKFRRAYMALPVSQRIEAGDINVLVEVEKGARGDLRITLLEEWEDDISISWKYLVDV